MLWNWRSTTGNRTRRQLFLFPLNISPRSRSSWNEKARWLFLCSLIFGWYSKLDFSVENSVVVYGSTSRRNQKKKTKTNNNESDAQQQPNYSAFKWFLDSKPLIHPSNVCARRSYKYPFTRVLPWKQLSWAKMCAFFTFGFLLVSFFFSVAMCVFPCCRKLH